MVKKEIVKTLIKIKWDRKKTKLIILQKQLKNSYNWNLIYDYLTLENSVFTYIYEYQEKNDDMTLKGCDFKVVDDFITRFNQISTIKEQFIQEYLNFDITALKIILQYMRQNYDSVIEEFENFNVDYKLLSHNQTNTEKYSLKIITETILYYLLVKWERGETTDDKLAFYTFEIFGSLCSEQVKLISEKKKHTVEVLPLLNKYLLLSTKIYLNMLIESSKVALMSNQTHDTSNGYKFLSVYKRLGQISIITTLSSENIRMIHMPIMGISIGLILATWHQLAHDWIYSVLKAPVDNRIRYRSTDHDTLEDMPSSNPDTNMLDLINSSALFFMDHLSCDFKTPDAKLNLAVSFYLTIAVIITSAFSHHICISDVMFPSLKNSYNNEFINYIFGIALYADKKYFVSRCSIEQTIDNSPNVKTSDMCLRSFCLISVYLNKTHEIAKARKLIDELLDMNQSFAIKINLMLADAICHLKNLSYATDLEAWKELVAKALSAINNAYELDISHPEVVFYKAYILALRGDIDESLRICQLSMQLIPIDPRPPHLLALLYSSKKDFKKALSELEIAQTKHPKNLNLLYLRIALSSRLRMYSEVKLAHHNAMDVINTINSNISFETLSNNYLMNIQYDTLDSANSTLKKHKHTKSTDLNKLSLKKMGETNVRHPLNSWKAISEIRKQSKELGEPYSKHLIEEIQIKISTITVECLYMTDYDYCDSIIKSCQKIDEAFAEIIYMQELINLYKFTKENDDFKNAISLFPTNCRLLYLKLHMLEKQYKTIPPSTGGESYAQETTLGLMEYYSKVLTNVDFKSCIAWKYFGDVLMRQNKHQEALPYLKRVIELEEINPIIPFESVPVIFYSSDS